MKKTAITLSLILSMQLYASELKLPPVLKADTKAVNNLPTGKFVRTGPTIQIAILLDSSNSMDGLIAQVKEQIWNIINEVSRANKNSKDVTMQVALYEYGKSSLPASTGYIKMLSPLTNDLDFLSEMLFALKTKGGSEYAGEAIGKASKDLYWSKHPDDLKIVIIAGNEAFDQGRVNYRETIRDAKHSDIIVNTIYCGSYQNGVSLEWKHGADLGGGKYMNIDSDAKVVHIPTPYDDQIIILNTQLNQTYIGYGRNGVKYKKRQIAEDSKNKSLSKSSYINRSVAKSTRQYKTDGWDAVSSYEKGNKSIAMELKQSNKSFSDKSEKEIDAIIVKQSKERRTIQKEIQSLETKRRSYIKKNPVKENKTFGDKIIKEIRNQMNSNGFVFN